MKKTFQLIKNMVQMTIASLALIGGMFLVIDWYDNPTHAGNLFIVALALYCLVIRFLTKIDYGDKRNIPD